MSNEHKFGVKRPYGGDDVAIYYLDGEELARVTYDDYGWRGMEGVENIIDTIAEKLGTEVIEMVDDEE